VTPSGAGVAQVLVSEVDDFPARLLLALKASNLSRSQLSAMLGVHKSLVSRWLSGNVIPTSYNLARISTLFANVKPGFNMTLWTAPRAEFEAALGLNPPPQHPSPESPRELMRQLAPSQPAIPSLARGWRRGA